MTNPKTTNPSSKHKRELEAVLIQLTSQRPSDSLQGMDRVRQWLQQNPEDREVFGVLLDAVKEDRSMREQIRNFLMEMIQKESNFAKQALDLLPSSAQDLLADADDEYYAAEYDQAIQVYSQVLRLDPDNARAKEQLVKAEIKRRDKVEAGTGLPRAAEQYYRKARSFIATRDVATAINLLKAAIEAAKEKRLKYPDAELALEDMQNLLRADELKQKANRALKEERWKDALDSYNEALPLDPSNVILEKEFESLQGLLRAKSELQWMKIFSSLRQYKNIVLSARGVVSPDNPLLNFVEKKLNLIRLIQSGFIFLLAILFFLFLNIEFDLDDIIKRSLATATPTPTATVFLTNTSIPASPEIPVEITATITPSATITNIPTATNTLEPVATATTVLGYGKLTVNFYPLQNPNGERVKETVNGKVSEVLLHRKQLVVIVESKNDHGALWYKCRWEINSGIGYGWVLGDKIQFVPPPAPTP